VINPREEISTNWFARSTNRRRPFSTIDLIVQRVHFLPQAMPQSFLAPFLSILRFLSRAIDKFGGSTQPPAEKCV
jgi:hypothetical protein